MWGNGGRSAATSAVLAGAVLVPGLAAAPAVAGDGKDDAHGRVSVVHENDTFEPRDRRAVAVIKDARAIERIADRVNERVALPHDGKVPPGVTDAVPRPDGRTIHVPPAFLTRIEGVPGGWSRPSNVPRSYRGPGTTPTT